MASSSLEGLCSHINTKIATVTRTLVLRRIVKEPLLKSFLRIVGKDLIALHGLLNKLEMEVYQQERLRDLLKKLRKSAEKQQLEAQHMCENIPQLPKRPQICTAVPAVKKKGQRKAVNPEQPKKPTRKIRVIKQVGLLTVDEFKGIPAYMKGRITYEQVNSTVNEINKAVEGKYKILHQPLKSMNAATRNLYHRFKEEETKDSKDEIFIVEADIKEFTQLKMDKRFHSILSILRHCRRLREVHSSKLVRYVIY